MYLLLASGAAILALILALFWLKDELRSPLLARIAYSELVARLALAGAAFCVIALLMILAELYESVLG